MSAAHYHGLKIVHRSASSALLTRLLVAAIITCVSVSTSGQTLGPPAKSADEIIKAYRKMDAGGGRLITNGWQKAAAFFYKPGPRPRKLFLTVIPDEVIGKAVIT